MFRQEASNVKVLSKKEVAQKLRISRATFDRLVKKGEFPPGIQLSSRRVGWLEAVVDEWLAKRQIANEAA